MFWFWWSRSRWLYRRWGCYIYLRSWFVNWTNSFLYNYSVFRNWLLCHSCGLCITLFCWYFCNFLKSHSLCAFLRIVLSTVHKLAYHDPECLPSKWLGEYISPHLLGGAVFNRKVSPINDIFHVEDLNVQMPCAFAWSSAVDHQPHHDVIVLI